MFEPLTKLIIKNIVNKSFKKELETANSGNSQTQIILLFFFIFCKLNLSIVEDKKKIYMYIL